MVRKTPARSYAAPSPPTAQTPFLSQAEQDLAASEQRFRLLVESVTDYAIYMLDPTGVVTNWNSGAQRFKGYAAHEIVGKHFSQFFTREDRQAGLPERILETAAREGRFEAEGVRVRKDGTHFWASVVVDTIRDETGELIGFAKITRDISERRRNEERLWHLAHYDALTDLPNRLTLCERLREALSSGAPLTLLMLDLDGFKEVNDTLGHAAGDAILKAAAERIKSSIGRDGIVGRLGGDEFAVVLPGLGDPTSFGLDVTAEGIEREEQRMRLRELGCESRQGYLFGRPVPATRMLELLAGGLHDGTARWSKAAIGLPLSLRA